MNEKHSDAAAQGRSSSTEAPGPTGASACFVIGLAFCCVVFAILACFVLVGGLDALFFCIFAGLHAAICAVFGLLRVAWRSGRPRPTRLGGFIVAGLKLGVILMFLSGPAAFLLMPRLAHIGEPVPSMSLQCRQMLRSIGLALAVYSLENGGWGPTIEPEARQLANAAGIASGSVLAFRDRDGQWRPSGLGRLYQEGFLMRAYKGEVLYCPAISGKDSAWVESFRYDPDDWPVGADSETTPGQCMLGPTDGDGVGELPRNPSVMITSYVLRTNPDNAWRSWKMTDLFGVAVVSDLLFFGSREAVFNHPQEYNVLFSDGSWKTYDDPAHVVRDACAAKAGTPDPDAAASEIFATFFDPFYMTDWGPIHRVSPGRPGARAH